MKMFFKTVGNRVDAPFIYDELGRHVAWGVRFDAEDTGFKEGVFYFNEEGERRDFFATDGVFYFNEAPEYRLYLMRGGWYCLEKRERIAGERWAIRFEVAEEEARKIEAGRGAAAEEIFRSYREKTL